MRTFTFRRLLATTCIAFLISSAASAQDWGVVVNGKAIHLNSEQDWNESNWGLGIEREFDRQSRWVKVVLGNGFRDSTDELSYMAGAGIKRRFRLNRLADDLFVDVGVIGFLMTRQDVGGNRPFPGLLPALTVGSRNVALNLTYLPRNWADMATNISSVDPNVDGILFLQLKLDARLFGFGRRSGPVLAAAD